MRSLQVVYLKRLAIAVFALIWIALGSPPASSAEPPTVYAPASNSVPAVVEAQQVTAISTDRYEIDEQRVPVANPSWAVVTRRQMQSHRLVSKALYDRIKAAALHNPFAPFDPYAVRGDAAPPQTPATSARFIGLPDLSGVEPPDMALAVSPRWVMQGVNLDFAVYDRNGVLQPGWPKSTGAFFHVPTPACNPNPFMSDPRAFYIIRDRRFVVAALQLDGPAIGSNCASLSKYWIAVSATNDPNGVWHIYAFDMRAGTPNLADFTQIGYDRNGIYFSGNMFDDTLTVYRYVEIFGASKADMESGMAATAHGFFHLRAGGELVDTVQPVESLTQPQAPASQPVEFFIDSKNLLNCPFMCRGVTVWAFANVLGTPSLSAANINTMPYSVPPPAFEPGGNFIDSGDQRVSATPMFQGGLISFGLTTGIARNGTEVAGLFWGQVHPALAGTRIVGGVIAQSGYFSYTGDRSAFYGAVVPDSRNDVYICFGSSSSTLNPGSYYAARNAADAPGTLEAPRPLIRGGSTYIGARWGDYSAAAIDGDALTSQAWIAAEYAAPGGGSGDWTTAIGATRFP